MLSNRRPSTRCSAAEARKSCQVYSGPFSNREMPSFLEDPRHLIGDPMMPTVECVTRTAPPRRLDEKRRDSSASHVFGRRDFSRFAVLQVDPGSGPLAFGTSCL